MAGPAPAADNGLEPQLDWSVIARCPAFPPVPFVASDELVDAYLQATGERHALYDAHATGFVPPLMATMVRLVKASLGGRWPSGTIQLDHRLATFRPIRRGEALTLDARIQDADIRHGNAYFTTRSVMRDALGAVVGVQSSTSMWAGAVAKAPPGTAGSPAAARRPVEPLQLPSSDTARFGPVACRYSLRRLRAFGTVAGARDPIHVDPAFAKATRFGTNIAQGRLVMALLSRLMLERFGREWLQASELSVRFVRPVPVDATVHAWGAPSEQDPGAYTVWCELAGQGPVIVGSAQTGTATSGWAHEAGETQMPKESTTT